MSNTLSYPCSESVVSSAAFNVALGRESRIDTFFGSGSRLGEQVAPHFPENAFVARIYTRRMRLF